MSIVGKSEVRVDAFDKATGRTKYYEDRMPSGALYARIKHSEIAHGYVKSIDTSAAEAIEGVVKVLTCFDVPDIAFPTAGHPWSMDPGHQDTADRHLLNRHVRYYGDEVAVVIAENEVAAMQGVRALKVEYDVLPFVLDVQKAMEPDAPQIHEECPGNVLKHTSMAKGNYDEAIKEEGLIKVEGWYETPMVQHCHIENHGCFAYSENGRITVVSSTQIPHIIRRIVGQALGRPWADIQIIKPYIGGGFGNKQDALYEPLCAWCSTQVNGQCVRIDCSREETFVSNRVRHAIRFHIITWLHKDGSIAARKIECFSNQGAYASHGHSIVAKAMGSFPQIYPCENFEGDAYTVYTNRPVAGAMRGYGMPQASFADDANIEECARAVGMNPIEYRNKFIMPKGFEDGFSHNVNYYDSFRECMEKGRAAIDYDRKLKEYQNQTGPVRRGIGMAAFWYNTAVYPISLETSSNRMQLNLDGTVTMQCGETEIGQGADTAYSKMTAEVVGLASYRDVHVVSCQDTDITPTGLGAYASRQTYVAGFSIRQTGELLKKKILAYASKLTRQMVENMDIQNSNIVRVMDGKVLMSLKELAMTAQYNAADSEHITAESTYTIRNNAYSFGCSFAEVEVDIPMCKVKLLNLVNVHDCGKLINPALAEAQVHGGMSMAIGYGLSEQLLFDEKTGRPLNNNLLDYKISTFMDHPNLEALFVENPEPTSPFGTKALGEPPACSGAPAIRNAILQATGVAIDKTPITPHVLFAEFTKAGACRLQEREDSLPDHCHHLCHPASAVHGTAGWLPDARQPLPRVRCDRASVGHRAERPDEHRHHHALDLCRRDHGRFELPEDRDAEDHPARSDCLRHLHGRRSDRRQHHVQALRQEGQPPDRLRRRVRCPDGSARLADGRSEGEPRELPADARHGTQRRRCYRLGNRGRLPAGSVRLKISGRKGLAFSAGLFLKERKTFLSEKITPRRYA